MADPLFKKAGIAEHVIVEARSVEENDDTLGSPVREGPSEALSAQPDHYTGHSIR